MNSPKKNRRSDAVQRYQILKELETALRKLDGGYVEYVNGQTDRTIADRLKVNVHSVVYNRQEVFGKLRESRTATGNRISELETKLQTLTKRNAELEAKLEDLSRDTRLADLQQRFAKLCLQLSTNRITDARHLSVVNGGKHDAA